MLLLLFVAFGQALDFAALDEFTLNASGQVEFNCHWPCYRALDWIYCKRVPRVGTRDWMCHGQDGLLAHVVIDCRHAPVYTVNYTFHWIGRLTGPDSCAWIQTVLNVIIVILRGITVGIGHCHQLYSQPVFDFH